MFERLGGIIGKFDVAIQCVSVDHAENEEVSIERPCDVNERKARCFKS